MRKLIVVASVLLGLFLAMHAYGQDASLSGNVADPSGAVIPGATVTATNEGTGVVSKAATNSAGVYNFSKLLFGAYTVKAEQKGFQTKSFTKVQLQVGQQARLNFQLEVSGVTTNVEVSTSGEQLLLESSSSVGDVLPAKTVQDLPQVNRDTMNLIRISSGVVVADDPIFGAVNTSFAGVSASAVNVQRDGVTVNGVRFLTGVNTPTRINPDLVGEFKMVLAPVDAEVGRGNAQIQIATKAGGNAYHGNAVWNVQNTALDPNTWGNNRVGAIAPWRNLEEYSISASGPIIKNKTFFFVLYDGQIAKRRAPYNAMSITPCARKGIFRYWDRWNNGNILTQPSTNTAANPVPNPVIPTVDRAGNPLKPQWEPNAWGTTTYTGSLRAVSIFKPLLNSDTINSDCSNAQFASSGYWDSIRPVQDPSGYIDDYFQKLPQPNNYDIGDGLNTAGFRWTRSLDGSVNLWGIGEDQFHKQINVRIDHNFSDKHRINGTWSFEKAHGDDTPKTWPKNSWSGGGASQPQVLTINFLSNISSNFLNEAKFGMSRTGSNIYSAADRPQNGDTLKQYLAQFGTLTNGEVGVVEAGPNPPGYAGLWNNFRTDGGSAFGGGDPHLSGAFGTRGSWANGNLFDTSPRYQWGDTVTWVKGSHSVRVGGEFRRSNSHSRDAWLFNPSNFQWGDSFPEIQGGELPSTPNTFSNVDPSWGADSLAGSDATQGNKRSMRDMLILLSGSLASIKQVRYINNVNQANQGIWNDPTKEPLMDRNTIMKEFSFFAKDDWKVTQSLTLNLGVRWDYYGVPFLANGITVGLKGGGSKIFGPTNDYSNWFAPIQKGDTPAGDLVSLVSIGPDSKNPDINLYPKTWTNVGPAIGFAYELPWLGKGKTTIRGGYQRSFISMAGNFQYVESAAGSSPGYFNINTWNNGGSQVWGDGTSYFGIKDLKTNPLFQNGVPISVQSGLSEFPIYDRQQSVSTYSSDYGYPHIDNLILAVTRNMTSNLSVDVRYIGTLTRRNFSSKDINVANFISNGLLDAFNSARAGQNPALLDQLLNGVALPKFDLSTFTFATCTVNGTTCHGADAIRDSNFFALGLPLSAAGAFTNLNSMLANGNFQGLANALNYLNKTGEGYGQYMVDNGFPVNFIKASPQFNTATLYENKGYANYHSMQLQVTLRPTHGLSFQTTYTLSKNLGNSGGMSPDPRDLATGYALQSSDRTHNWVTFGTYDLPFGPGQKFGKSSNGVLSRVIGGWQLGWITSVISGAPLAATANCGLYANCTPDAVNGGIDPKSASISWPNGARNGSLFSDRYAPTTDPQCAGVWNPGLCTLTAMTDSKTSRIVLQNPAPGRMGSVTYNSFRDHGRWNVDMSITKSVAITETKRFQFRADIANIFNHPMASGVSTTSGRVQNETPPIMSINPTNGVSYNLGYYSEKVGGRTFQAMLRFDF
jgi:hypothetical protein